MKRTGNRASDVKDCNTIVTETNATALTGGRCPAHEIALANKCDALRLKQSAAQIRADLAEFLFANSQPV